MQDTSEINLDNHHNRNRLKSGSGVGLTGNYKDLGFFLHGSLVLDTDTEVILRYSNIQLWHRQEDEIDKVERNHKYQPIEEKESCKWIKACNESKDHLYQDQTITFVEDWEGDIYHQFAELQKTCKFLLNRS